MAQKLVSQWAYPSNQKFYASYAAASTRMVTEYQHDLHLYQFNMWWLLHFRGNDDGHGQRMTRINRNQTILPVALMLMMMLRDGGG